MGLKTYYEAIRSMPDEYVADDTTVIRMEEGQGLIKGVAAGNPRLPPIIYRASTRSWEKMKPLSRVMKKIKRHRAYIDKQWPPDPLGRQSSG